MGNIQDKLISLKGAKERKYLKNIKINFQKSIDNLKIKMYNKYIK